MELLRKIKKNIIYIKPDKEDQDGLIFGFIGNLRGSLKTEVIPNYDMDQGSLFKNVFS